MVIFGIAAVFVIIGVVFRERIMGLVSGKREAREAVARYEEYLEQKKEGGDGE